MQKLILTLILLWIVVPNGTAQEKPLNILVITGGHDFNEPEFWGMFDSLKNIKYRHVKQPEANTLYSGEEINQYDALVFYDMWNKIEENQKEDLLKLLKKGKGMVFLHHSLVSYQQWNEFTNIIGGKYYLKADTVDGVITPASNFKHGINVSLLIRDSQHFITKKLKPFTLYDEVYGNFVVSPRAHPLLSTDNPLSSPIVGWTNHYENSRIVYLQPGHGPESFRNPNYRTLLRRSIAWVSGK